MAHDTARVPADRDWISTGQAVALGAVLGLPATVVAAVTLDHRLVLDVGAVTVAMVYGVYFGFAIGAGDARDLVVETVFIVVGLTTAVLTLEHGPVWAFRAGMCPFARSSTSARLSLCSCSSSNT